MDILIVIALLAWVFISSANRKKARKQQEEKNRRAVQEAERQQAPQAKQAASAPPLRPQVKPTVQPRQTAPQPQRPHVVQPSRATGHAHTESSMTGFAPCPPARASAPRSGNRGQNSSLGGRSNPAPIAAQPGRAAASASQPAAAAPKVVSLETSAQPAFVFDPLQVRNGLIYAEILGKPKALRHVHTR